MKNLDTVLPCDNNHDNLSKHINELNAIDLKKVKISVIANQNSVNDSEAVRFQIQLSMNNELVKISNDILATVMYTATCKNGDEYIGTKTFKIASGLSKLDCIIEDQEMMPTELDYINIKLTSAECNNNENITIDSENDSVAVKIISSPCYLKIEEMIIDEMKGLVEFTIVLSDADLDKSITVDYILGKDTSPEISAYIIDTGTLIFNPGITSHTVTLCFSEKDYKQCNGDFDIVLTNGVNAHIEECSGHTDAISDQSGENNVALASIKGNCKVSHDDHDETCSSSFTIEIRDNNGDLTIATTDINVEVQYWGTMLDKTDFVGKTNLIFPANTAVFDFDIANLDNVIVRNSESVNIKLIEVSGGGFDTIDIDQSRATEVMNIASVS
ncbi:hypothetical protein [Psychrobacter sp.]|uniref:hypothetical protein n=1 Tax=Psychrobacter sp. TaxID=56811 RepID=UPI0025F4B78A|nr:hypothetical protein [Psychrobacter sp.]